jgi:O-antigen ligase
VPAASRPSLPKRFFTWPWPVTVPLLAAALILSVFFKSTDNICYPVACVLLLAFCAAHIAPCLVRRRCDVPLTNSVCLPLVFGAYLCAAVLWTNIPYNSIIFTLVIAMLPLMVLAISLAPARARLPFAYAATFIAVAAGFAVWALVQFFFFFGTYGPRIHEPMLNPNDMASFFNLALLPVTAFFFRPAEEGREGRRDWAKAGLFALAVLLYFALLVTQSRGALISFVIGLAALAPFLLGRRPFPWAEALAFALVLVSAPFIVDHLSHGWTGRALSMFVDMKGSSSVSDRLELWRATLRMAQDHFWRGTGLGTFYYYYTAYRSPVDTSDGYFAHMDPLQFWAETGIAAPVLFYAALAAVLARTIRALRVPGGAPRLRLLMMGFFCGMLAVLLNTHISFHLYMPALIVPLAAVYACWYGLSEKLLGCGDRAALRLGGWRGAVFAALWLAILVPPALWAALWAKSTHSLHKLSLPAATMTESELTKLETKALKAQRFAPPGYGKFDEYLARIYIVRLSGDIRHMDKRERDTFFREAVAALDRAEKKNPAYVLIWDMRARLYYAVDGVLMDDGYEKAVALLKSVIAFDPLAVDSRVGLAKLYNLRGKRKEARAVLDDGMKWPRPRGRTDINYLIATAQMHEATGDEKGAARLLEEVKKRARAYGYVETPR